MKIRLELTTSSRHNTSAAHLRFFISAAPFQLLYRIVYFITFPVFL